MTFKKYIEEIIGIAWNDFDENYSGNALQELYDEYNSFMEEMEEEVCK